MKDLIIEFKVYRIDGGVRYESGEQFIEFLGDSQKGMITSSTSLDGTYERDEYDDMYFITEGSDEYIGSTELNFAINFLAEANGNPK